MFSNFTLVVRLLLKTIFYSIISFDELWGDVIYCFKKWIADALLSHKFISLEHSK